MPTSVHRAQGSSRRVSVAVLLPATVAIAVFSQMTSASAAQPTVNLGTADSFAVLAGSTVTNTGATTVSGDVGVSPGAATPGLTGAMVTHGTVHRSDAPAASAQADLTTAYNSAAGRGPRTSVPTELGGRRLVGGVYAGPTLAVTGTLSLDAQNDPATVFVFQTTSTLLLASSSRILLLNGASACNVFWQVGSSATLGTRADFAGTILALTSITATTGASVRGRLLARNGAVTLDTNSIVRPDCATTPTSPSSSGSSSSPTSPASSSSPPSTSSPSGDTSGSASPTPDASATSAGPTTRTLTPSTGSSAGGTDVTISGTGFVPGSTTVTIGGTTVPASDVTVHSPRELTFTTPAHAQGRVPVVVSTPRGTTRRQGLTYTYEVTTELATTGTADRSLLLGAGSLVAFGLAVLWLARPQTGRHHR